MAGVELRIQDKMAAHKKPRELYILQGSIILQFMILFWNFSGMY